jgi:predicted dehydrogenase
MRINFCGQVVDEPEIRAGFIGCGPHSFRNIFPTFQFAPVNLVATCDLSLEKAQAFATKFGARAAYANHLEMLEKEQLDAVFIVTGYDERGRPQYPRLSIDCLNAGCHVWIEKPPAGSCAELEAMRAAADANGKIVVTGMKKMFSPANEKAKELMGHQSFGQPMLAMLQYPQKIPTVDELRRYIHDFEHVPPAIGFLDHLCHPMSLIVFLLGMPETLSYELAPNSGGIAVFRFASGAVASLALTAGSAHNGGMERTVIISDRDRHIVVENNVRVSYCQNPTPDPFTGYGCAPNFFTGLPETASAYWEPEFSLGQLYNKGLFLLGYYNEVNEFARAILEKRSPVKGTLEQALQITHVFEAFAEGPGKTIALK